MSEEKLGKGTGNLRRFGHSAWMSVLVLISMACFSAVEALASDGRPREIGGDEGREIGSSPSGAHSVANAEG